MPCDLMGRCGLQYGGLQYLQFALKQEGWGRV